ILISSLFLVPLISHHAPLPSELSTLSLHDALPIFRLVGEPVEALRLLEGRVVVVGEVRVDLPRHVAVLAPALVPHRAEQVARLRSEEHTSELQSRVDLVCRLLLEQIKLENALCWSC